MDREQARQEIRSRIKCTDYLEKSKGGLYCCPHCGSGSGRNGTGAVKYYPDSNTYFCHACHKSGDVIDAYQATTGADYNAALAALADELGITVSSYRPETAFVNLDHAARPLDTERAPDAPPAQPVDYTDYFKTCAPRITDPAALAYLQKRGISLPTAGAYWLGYDPEADPAAAPGGTTPPLHPCPRIIIPTSPQHYIGRSIDPNTPKAYAKMNPKDSTPAIFNGRVLHLQDVQEVFVVEGAFDALSIIEAGAAAIALNSAGNRKALLELLERKRTAATLILCKDNDADPKTAERIKKEWDELADGLRRLNVSYVVADINGEYKDANEHLTGDREGFFAAVAAAKRKAEARPDNTADYIDSLMAADIEKFKADKKTGFFSLDAVAGGLYPGLYVLAAISSLGKTSFALQLADQLAERGNDVIFFSLEQSRLELTTKSIARRLAKSADPVTSLSIRKGYIPQRVKDAAEEYKKAVGNRVSIVEGNFGCDVSFIGDYIRQYIRRTGARPVVIVDYLQILQPSEEVRKKSTKDAVDDTVTSLKRMSREMDLTVLVISSVNRANYMQPIDFESLKESGGIEYTADVVWGLQLQCLNEDLFATDKKIKEKRERVKEAKTETPRKVELVCLKNRYGISTYSCKFDYDPAHDLFTESGSAGDEDDDDLPEGWRSTRTV